MHYLGIGGAHNKLPVIDLIRDREITVLNHQSTILGE